MNTKRIKIGKAELPNVEKEYNAFGYKLYSYTKNDSGKPIWVTFVRDRKQRYYHTLKKLERQYKKVKIMVPIATIIWFIIGFIAIGGYIALSDKVYALAILIESFVNFAIGTYLLIAFLLVKTKRNKLMQMYLEEGLRLQGYNKDFPTYLNIQEPGPYTYRVKKNLKIIIRELKKAHKTR